MARAKGLILADSGPLYASASPTDQSHNRAIRDLKEIGKQKLDVAVLWPVLLESYNLMLHRHGPRYAHRFLDQIRNGCSMLNPAHADYEQAVAQAKRYGDQSLTLVDSLVATVADRLAVSVWTYDHHFDVMKTPVWRP